MDMQRNERTAAFTLIALLDGGAHQVNGKGLKDILQLADDKVGGSSGNVHVMFPF